MLAVVKFIPRKSVIVAIAALCLCGCSSETPSNTLGAAVSAPGAATPDPSEANTQNSLTLVTELPTPKQSRGGTEDIIIPGDVLQIDVFGIDKLNRTVTVLCEGKVLCEGPLEKVQADERVIEAYLGR